MKQRPWRWFFVLTSCFLAFACEKDKPGEPVKDRGEEYFPTNVGTTYIYQVDSLVYNSFFERVDTISYQVRHRYADTVTDRLKPTLLLIRDIRSDSISPWIFDEEREITEDAEYIQEKVNNELFVKFSFPVTLFRNWDGNLFNSNEAEWYEFRQVHAPYSGEYFSGDSSVQVIQRERFNALQEIYGEEIYLRNVGLVYLRQTDKRSTSIGQQIPDGYDVMYRLKELSR